MNLDPIIGGLIGFGIGMVALWWRSAPAPVVEVDLTNEAFARWLRAGRPPLPWFLGRESVEQEQMALLGDSHARDVALAVGYSVADPELAAQSIRAAAGETGAEEAMLAKIAERALRRAGARSVPATADTMAGAIERRKASAAAAEAAKGKSMFGRAPDPKEPAT